MNKNGYFKCENCNHYQHATEFGECAECGYEDLIEISKEEYERMTSMTSKIIKSKSNRKYVIQYNETLDICIIMDCMAEESRGTIPEPLYEYVGYFHGTLSETNDSEIMWFINIYEAKIK